MTITATVTKETIDSKVGIDFNTKSDGTVLVSYVAGLFAETDIKVGYEVILLNADVVRGKSPDELKAIIRSTEGDITIVANPAAPAVFTGAIAIATPTGEADVPGRAPPGGIWGTLTYAGSTTGMVACGACLCCGPLACCIMLCPVDEMDAYSVGGKIYDASGQYKQPADPNKFKPSRQAMKR